MTCSQSPTIICVTVFEPSFEIILPCRWRSFRFQIDYREKMKNIGNQITNQGSDSRVLVSGNYFAKCTCFQCSSVGETVIVAGGFSSIFLKFKMPKPSVVDVKLRKRLASVLVQQSWSKHIVQAVKQELIFEWHVILKASVLKATLNLFHLDHVGKKG